MFLTVTKETRAMVNDIKYFRKIVIHLTREDGAKFVIIKLITLSQQYEYTGYYYKTAVDRIELFAPRNTKNSFINLMRDYDIKS